MATPSVPAPTTAPGTPGLVAPSTLSSTTTSFGAASTVPLATSDSFPSTSGIANGTQPASPTSSDPVSTPKTYDATTLAGVGVGAGVGGVILALLLVWCCIRLRQSRQHRPNREYRSTGFQESTQLQPLKGSLPTPSSAGTGSPGSIIDRNLPQPVADGSIETDLSKMCSLIDQHVESFYHLSPVLTSSMPGAGSIQWLEHNPDLSTQELNVMLRAPKSRKTAIRYCIGRTVVMQSEENSDPESTFLPPALPMFIRSLPDAVRHDSGKWPSERASYCLLTCSLVGRVVLSRWYTMSGFLLSNEIVLDDPRYRNIHRAIAVLDSLLSPYTDLKSNNDRIRNLAEIMSRGARFGFVLFSQPLIGKSPKVETQGRLRYSQGCYKPQMIPARNCQCQNRLGQQF